MNITNEQPKEESLKDVLLHTTESLKEVFSKMDNSDEGLYKESPDKKYKLINRELDLVTQGIGFKVRVKVSIIKIKPGEEMEKELENEKNDTWIQLK